MLRIKKDIPLEKLGEYGFKRDKLPYCIDDYYIKNFSKNYVLLLVNITTKEIKIFLDDDFYECFLNFDLSILYDLIQDGLVEKVEEVEND